MNFIKIGKILGKIMILESILMLLPLAVAIIYQEGLRNILAFAVPIFILALLGILLQLPKAKRDILYQKEGFALTAMVWLVMTLFGAIPFVINRDIPNYIDAWFEIMSGFTTTGSSIITDITAMSHSTLFWRSFSHWIGGMGILVFVLIFIPESNDGSSMHLLRAESPGPQVGKLASKMKVTTRILYLIYLGMTAIEILILYFGPLTDYAAMVEAFGEPMAAAYHNDKLFNALLASFGCAGTGGFGFIPNSMEYFTPFAQYVMATFLILFGVNFSLYYLILIGKIVQIFKSEEFRSYCLLLVFAVGLVFFSLMGSFGSVPQEYTVEEAFRHSLFQVASLISTTGFSTTDFNLWPMLGRTVLLVVMLTGAMAGSTAGGIKISRIVIAFKGAMVNIRKLINPRYVPKSKIEGKLIEERTTNDVFSFITLYFFLLVGVVVLLSFDPINGQAVTIVSDAGEYTVTHDFYSNFSATVACLSNIGPGFEAVGPYSSYAGFSWLSKVILTLTMMIGRLEILPVLILFNPKTWKRT